MSRWLEEKIIKTAAQLACFANAIVLRSRLALSLSPVYFKRSGHRKRSQKTSRSKKLIWKQAWLHNAPATRPERKCRRRARGPCNPRRRALQLVGKQCCSLSELTAEAAWGPMVDDTESVIRCHSYVWHPSSKFWRATSRLQRRLFSQPHIFWNGDLVRRWKTQEEIYHTPFCKFPIAEHR